jgi:hypothetical protein
MEKTGPGEFGACFLYFPQWSLDELYEARPYMCDELGIPVQLIPSYEYATLTSVSIASVPG